MLNFIISVQKLCYKIKWLILGSLKGHPKASLHFQTSFILGSTLWCMRLLMLSFVGENTTTVYSKFKNVCQSYCVNSTYLKTFINFFLSFRKSSDFIIFTYLLSIVIENAYHISRTVLTTVISELSLRKQYFFSN